MAELTGGRLVARVLKQAGVGHASTRASRSSLGARGVLVREPRDLAPALDKVLGSNEVWCVNVVLDPAAYRNTGTMSMAI